MGAENEPQPDITRLLDRWSQGDDDAFKSLMPLVYEELRQLADHYLRDEKSGHTLQPTALVHEAYLRLIGINDMRFENRTHFYGAAAQAMRRILVDHARRRNAGKRWGGGERVDMPDVAMELPVDLQLDLVALDEALERFAAFAPEKAKVVELRYFAGLSVEETADLLAISPATVKRHWMFARAWLLRAMTDGNVDPPASQD